MSVSSALLSTLWLLYCFYFTRLILPFHKALLEQRFTTPNCTLTCCRYFPGRKLSLRGAARACRAQALPCAAKYYQQLLDLLSVGLGGYKVIESATTATSAGTTISAAAAADSDIPTYSANTLSPELKLAHEALVFLQAQSSPSRAASSFPATPRPLSLWHIYTGGNAALDGSDSGSPHLLYALVPLAVMVFGCVGWVWITMKRLRSKVLDHMINSQPGGRSSLRSRRWANGHDDGGPADHHDDTGDGQATEGAGDREERTSTGTTSADRRSRRDGERQVLLRNRRSASAW